MHTESFLNQELHSNSFCMAKITNHSVIFVEFNLTRQTGTEVNEMNSIKFHQDIEFKVRNKTSSYAA